MRLAIISRRSLFSSIEEIIGKHLGKRWPLSTVLLDSWTIDNFLGFVASETNLFLALFLRCETILWPISESEFL